MKLPQHLSLSNEHYTPSLYIEGARSVMGGIDLDPASCVEAQQTVKATEFYALPQDGLLLPWRGRIWCNPPYGFRDPETRTPNKKVWTQRLLSAYEEQEIEQAFFLVTASTGDAWFQPLWAHWLCFPRRIKFKVPKGGNAHNNPGSSVIAYLGPNTQAFDRIFSELGRVVPPCRAFEPTQLRLFQGVA